MLDIKFIQENKDIVLAAIKHKQIQPVDLDRLLALADERRVWRQTIDDLNRQKNEAAAARDVDAGKALKDKLQAAEDKLRTVTKELMSLMDLIPNIPLPDIPIGPDESGNQVLREIGEKPNFNFTPKEHWELGRALGVLDTEKAAEVSGARFAYLKGDLARLEMALMDLAWKTLTSRETLAQIIKTAGLEISDKPFTPIIPPLLMRSPVMRRMARLNPIDERYYFEKDDLVFIGSAEHTLGPLHMDETIPEEHLPLRYAALTPAFRREAGSYGKDTKGILRLHQFNKLEMESFSRPEEGRVEQDFLVAIQEHLMQQLKLPYRVVAVCTGDMGFPDQRQIDIEVWLPGQQTYRETHTADYIGGFQARRLNTKIKRADGTTEPVHMNDATALSERPLIAIMENYQTAAGDIEVPAVLRSYLGFNQIKKRS